MLRGGTTGPGLDKDLAAVPCFLDRLRKRYQISEARLFGSRATGTALRHSDLDVLLVSPDFRGMFFTSRMTAVLHKWDEPMDLETLCYTPEEFERKRAQFGIVREVVSKGIQLA